MSVLSPQIENRVVLTDISCATFEALLADTDHRSSRFTYDRGSLEIPSPSLEHGRISSLIGRMNDRAKKRIRKTCNKAFFIFFVALWVLLSFGKDGFLFGEPSSEESALAADEFSAISKEIQQTVKALGYSGDVDIDLVQIASGWKYVDWRQMLSRAKQDYQQKKISADRVAQAEEEVLKELCQAIRKEFDAAAGDSEYFYLSKVVKDRKAQCLGYSQLLYILGNVVGLKVKVVDVLEPFAGPLPPGEEHTACLVELTGGKTVMADLTQESAGKSFVFQEQFGAAGNYWELKQKENPLKIHRRIQILDKNGLVADIYSNLGNAYAKSGKDAEAVSFLSKAVELNPKLAKAYSSRGVELFKKGQRAKGTADLEKAIEIDPKDAEAYNNLGSVYFGLGQDAKAISNFSKAIELKPTFSEAYKSRGTVYAKLGQNTEAIADLAKAVELSPKDAEAFFLLGTMYAQADKQAKAVSYFTKALEINPKYSEAYNERGRAYGLLGKYTDAISDFIKAVELDPKNVDAYHNRGIVYRELDQNDLAISNFTKAIEINPKYIGAYMNRGTTYGKLGQNTKAIADFNKVIQLNSKYARAYLNRGLAYGMLKKNVEAKRDLERAVALDPASKEEVQKILDKLKISP